MNLYDGSVAPHVLIKLTEKNFFNIYPYKLTFIIDHDQIEPKFLKDCLSWSQLRKSANSNLRHLMSEMQSNIASNIRGSNNKFRIDNTSTSIKFYTSDECDVKSLINNVSDRLYSIHCPLNDNHKELLLKNHAIRVRNSLFDSKFKYKVYIRHVWEDRKTRFSDVTGWLLETMGDDNDRWRPNSTLRYFMHTDIEHRHLGYTIAFYLRDMEDVMMCNLRFDSVIEKIEEAVLVSDL